MLKNKPLKFYFGILLCSIVGIVCLPFVLIVGALCLCVLSVAMLFNAVTTTALWCFDEKDSWMTIFKDNM